jgi:hypothetical protein
MWQQFYFYALIHRLIIKLSQFRMELLILLQQLVNGRSRCSHLVKQLPQEQWRRKRIMYINKKGPDTSFPQLSALENMDFHTRVLVTPLAKHWVVM